ncbi:hypothetical protein ABPG74_012044 [Tetrahymena malaccensis]
MKALTLLLLGLTAFASVAIYMVHNQNSIELSAVQCYKIEFSGQEKNDLAYIVNTCQQDLTFNLWDYDYASNIGNRKTGCLGPNEKQQVGYAKGFNIISIDQILC